MAEELPDFPIIGETLTPDGLIPADQLNTPPPPGRAQILADGLTWARRDVQPASEYYISPSHRMFVRIETSLTSAVVRVAAFIQRVDGRVEEINRTVTGASADVVTEDIFELFEGFLLCVSATTDTSGAEYGSIFVTVGVCRGAGAGFIVPHILISRYLIEGQFAGWPESPVVSSVDGPGRIRVVTGSAPSQGSDIAEVVPDNRRWRLVTWRATFTASVVIQQRGPMLELTDGTGILARLAPTSSVTANQVVAYNYVGSGVTPGSLSGETLIGLPDRLLLRAGFGINTQTFNMDASDSWSAPVMLIEEWIERSP